MGCCFAANCSIHHHLLRCRFASPSSALDITRSSASARVFDALLPYATRREPINRCHPAVQR